MAGHICLTETGPTRVNINEVDSHGVTCSVPFHSIHACRYLLLITLPIEFTGPHLDAAQKRGWSIVEVEGLSKIEKAKFIGTFLALHGKKLNTEQLTHIISAEQTESPQYLRIVLEEVRISRTNNVQDSSFWVIRTFN